MQLCEITIPDESNVRGCNIVVPERAALRIPLRYVDGQEPIAQSDAFSDGACGWAQWR